jgi:hypothetical protein
MWKVRQVRKAYLRRVSRQSADKKDGRSAGGATEAVVGRVEMGSRHTCLTANAVKRSNPLSRWPFFDRMFLLSEGRQVAFFDDSDVSGVAD